MGNTKTDRANLSQDEIAAAEKALAEAKAAEEKAAEEQAEEKALAEAKAAEKKAIKEAATTKTDKTEAKTLRALAETYRKSYPECKTFYITSDEQIFLSDAYNMALLHQRTLKTGELTTINF